MSELARYFWAKTLPESTPGVSVIDHMKDVGFVAQALMELVPALLEKFKFPPSVISALVAMHDVGKISPGFQMQCATWLEENQLTKICQNWVWDSSMEGNHGKVSHAVIQSYLSKIGFNRNTSTYVSAAIGAHHGRLNRPNERGYRPEKATSESNSGIPWEAEQISALAQVWSTFVPQGGSISLNSDDPRLWWLAGLTTVADWIGSDARYFIPSRRDETIDSYAAAKQAIQDIGFSLPPVELGLKFNDLFGDSNKLGSFWRPNDVQLAAFEAIEGPGVYIVEAPMGMGKTEAALWATYKLLGTGVASGMYFALPTQATSNRIHLRINDFLLRIFPDQINSRLAHANSWLFDKQLLLNPGQTQFKESSSEDARVGRDWFASIKRALLYPFGVGTVDQALLGVVAAKHFFVRQFALAGKVVILDEVHSYDLYTGTLIDELIRSLEKLNCTVIILSATLSKRRVKQLNPDANVPDSTDLLDYPLITGRTSSGPIAARHIPQPESRAVKVNFISEQIAIERAVTLAEKGGSVLWIANTIDEAQRIYRLLQSTISDNFPLGLLHSRFPFWQREILETEWMIRFGKSGETRCGSILVSTQIVEQSVDLDADLLISELAPSDMLIQRIGRLWRHKRNVRPVDEPCISILEESSSLTDFREMSAAKIKNALGKKAYVYDPYILLRTLNVWRGLAEVQVPRDIRALIERTYGELDGEPEGWTELATELTGSEFAKKMVAQRNSNIWQVALEDHEGVQTRLNERPTVALVLCKSRINDELILLNESRVKLNEIDYNLPDAKAINKNMLRIPRHILSTVPVDTKLANYISGQCLIGIVTQSGQVDITCRKEGTKITYDKNLGIVINRDSYDGE